VTFAELTMAGIKLQERLEQTPAFIQNIIGLCIAGCLVFLIGQVTNSTPPYADAKHYVRMAGSGVFSDPHVAPFVYRPVVPFIVNLLSRFTPFDILTIFQKMATLSSVLLLWITYLFARSLGASIMNAIIVMLVVALSFSHVKRAIFFPTSIDIEASVIFFLAMWAVLKRRDFLCFILSLVGLLTKEFLAIPAALLCLSLLQSWYVERKSSYLNYFLLAALAFSAAVIVPRIYLSVPVSYQYVDPINKFASIKLLLKGPLIWQRDVNLLLSWVGYWLPTLVLLTADRVQRVCKDLQKYTSLLILYLFILLLLNMYGGTNFFIFVSYAVVLQSLALTYILQQGVRLWEPVTMLAVVMWYNKTLLAIPLPLKEWDLFRQHTVGGWDIYIGPQTWIAFLKIFIIIIGFVITRKAIEHFGPDHSIRRERGAG
jgi:hypothetical protein